MLEGIHGRVRHLERKGKLKEVQRRQSRSLKRNTNEIRKMWQNKNVRKEHSEGKSYQEDLW